MSRALISLCMFVALGVSVAHSQQSPQSIVIENAWARATAGGARTGAAYLTLRDTGAPDRLVGTSTPVATTAEVHETIDDHGVMKMRPVTGLDLEPGKAITLAPGGLHVMLTGLKQPLVVGQTFPITLTFEHAAPVTTTVTVAAVGATGPTEHGAMGGMNMTPPTTDQRDASDHPTKARR